MGHIFVIKLMKGLAVRSAGIQVLLVLLLTIWQGEAMAGDITLLSPTKDCVVYARTPTTHMVISVSDKNDLKSLRLESASELVPPRSIHHKTKGYFLHYRVPLKPGKNIFTLNPGGMEITLDYKPLRTLLNANFDAPDVFLYHRDGTMHDECRECHEVPTVPEDYYVRPTTYGSNSPTCYSCHHAIFEETVWQHSPAANLLCETCHREDDKVGRISVTVGKDATLCYQCHLVKGKAWGEMAHIHQPVGFGVCSICHNPHGDKNRFQLWADGKAEMCVTCHVDKEKLLKKQTEGLFVHGIIKGGGCIACHDPHASPNPFMLFKPVNDLCASCHNDFLGMTKGHPVSGHPLKGPKNPIKPDAEFNCASCHNPHGSPYKYLLIGDILGGHVCAKCHN